MTLRRRLSGNRQDSMAREDLKIERRKWSGLAVDNYGSEI